MKTNKCFVNGIGCISAQPTFEDDLLENLQTHQEKTCFEVVKPNYKEFIPATALRRMKSGIKNAVVASSLAIKDAEINQEKIEAIITGTAFGGRQYSDQFLDRLVKYKEEYLSPTPFIQSTHNTVGGQIALNLNNHAYNVTYVNSATAFSSALLDALLYINTAQKSNILVGGVDELSKQSIERYRLVDHYKLEKNNNFDILNSTTKGCFPGEGAGFFMLSKAKKENTYAELVDVQMKNNLKTAEVKPFISSFLKQNQLDFKDIEVLLLGNNGDVNFDYFYEEVEKHFSHSENIFYKHLFCDFPTYSAIAFWLAVSILKAQNIPQVLYRKTEKPQRKNIKNILLYNQYRGKDHSLMLLKNV